MTITKLTEAPTEADLNARLDAAIKHALPWLGSESVRRETKFKVQIGRASVPIKNDSGSHEARADVLLYSGDTPLAVFELKRQDLKLSLSDEKQGLSYAKLLSPSPPLVVITNGTDVRILETHTGNLWAPESPSEQALKDLLDNASKVAKGELKEAIHTLMHDSPAVWMAAVREISNSNIEALSGSWEDSTCPFVSGWILPREATNLIEKQALAGLRVSLLVGAPLSGKSNVLREICLRTMVTPTIATLYLCAGVGSGIFQTLANALNQALGWPITPSEARNWLIHISKQNQHKLLVLLDDLDPSDITSRRELEELISDTFGSGLSVAVAVHESGSEQLCRSKNMLSLSLIGMKAKVVTLSSLSDEEFKSAQEVLAKRHMLFTTGAQYSAEMREPWVIRAVSSHVQARASQLHGEAFASLPPMLSLSLLSEARVRFKAPELIRYYQAIASALLADAKDRDRGTPLLLESLHTYVVRRLTLDKYLPAEEINRLLSLGFVRPAIQSDEPVLYVRLPELVASELSKKISKEMAALFKNDIPQAAKLLVNAAENLPLGDIVAAQSVMDCMASTGTFPYDLIVNLLDLKPTKRPIQPGTKFGMDFPGVGYVMVDYLEGGKVKFKANGRISTADVSEFDFGAVIENAHPWVILSHLVNLLAATRTDEDGMIAMAPYLIKEIGESELLLRRPGQTLDSRRAPMHELQGGAVVCHHAGFLEQITYSTYEYLAHEGQKADAWIDEVIDLDSPFLLSRVHIALQEITTLSEDHLSQWAVETLETRVGPALAIHIDGVCE